MAQHLSMINLTWFYDSFVTHLYTVSFEYIGLYKGLTKSQKKPTIYTIHSKRKA